MKARVPRYLQLNRAERMGFAALLLLILVLLGVRFSMYLWVRPGTGSQEEQQFAEAWQAFGRRKDSVGVLSGNRFPVIGNASVVENAFTSENVSAAEGFPAALFFFDPNTLDSTGFRRLGLREQTTRMLLNWRRKGKRFRVKEDLRPLYSLSEVEYRRLEPYIRIAIVNTSTGSHRDPERYGGHSSYGEFRARQQEPVDLNTADSQALVRLRGIGPVLSQKIIARRAALGGFVHHDQLLEIYRFNDTVMELLRQRLVIHPGNQVKININSATETQLAAHPYIGKSAAARIISFREDLGGFSIIEQLKQVPLMNDENYRKIALYFTVE